VRIGFFGTPQFAVPTLRAILDAGHEVAVVVAQPDRPAGRGQQLQSPPTVQLARERGIPTLQPLKVKTGEFPEAIEALGLDLAVVVAYGRILTPRLLAAPRLGCVNVHASLLPRWRGAAPIQWSILAGDAETGVTTMRMDAGLDTGDMLLVARTPIGPRETSGELHDRLSEIGAELLVRTLASPLRPTPQPTEGVTLAPMLTKEDGRLDWTRPAVELDRRVRGLSPWPGTFTTFRGEPMKVLRTRPAEGAGAFGEILRGAVVACGEGALELEEVQLPGKRAVKGADWVNGSRVGAGEKLG
jgi:methionyl-tRNA formyltransferase